MEFLLDFSNTTNFTIPIFAVNNDAQLIIDNHSRACPLCNMTVVVVADEPNTWRLLLTNMIFVPIFCQVILLLCSFGILGYSAYIYYLFIKYSGFRINVSQVCLVLEAISCIFKIIWLLFDPFWAFKEDIPPWFNTALETSWIPFTFGSNLLIPFYWNEILGNNMKVTPFLSKLKILFIILFILSIIFEGFSEIARVIDVSTIEIVANTMVTLGKIYYGVLLVFLIVLFIITFAKLRTYITGKRSLKAYEAKPRDLNVLSFKMLICAIFLFIIIGVFAFVVFHYDEYPWGRLLIIFFLFTFSNIIAIIQLSSFTPRKGKKKGTSDSTSKGKNFKLK